MASEIWTSTPPSEQGDYRVQWPIGIEEAVHVDVQGRLFGFGSSDPIDITQPPYIGTVFGPRIPSAAELHQHAEALTANIVARAEAERRCRELEKERIGLLHTLLMIADRDIRDHDDYKAMAQWCVACAASEKPRERIATPQDSPEDSE